MSSNAPGGGLEKRRPYVLVLVDGNDYLFKDELVKAEAIGGLYAAKLFHNTIRQHFEDTPNHSAQYCIHIRVYAQKSTETGTLAKYKVANGVLAGFISGFNSFHGLSHFVIAGTKLVDVASQIKENLEAFWDDPQCRQIFFAACTNMQNVSVLSLCDNIRDRVTLVKAAGWRQECDRLDFQIVEMPTIFESNFPLSDDKTTFPALTTAHPERADHTPTSNDTEIVSSTIQGSDKDESLPYKRGDEDALSMSEPAQSHAPSVPKPALPKSSARGMIPVNALAQRIDDPLPTPDFSEWKTYGIATRGIKLCHAHHLAGLCQDYHCQRVHGSAEETVIKVLTFIARNIPCARKSRCRIGWCFRGHACSKRVCPGTRSDCAFHSSFHGIDMVIADYVDATSGHIQSASLAALQRKRRVENRRVENDVTKTKHENQWPSPPRGSVLGKSTGVEAKKVPKGYFKTTGAASQQHSRVNIAEASHVGDDDLESMSSGSDLLCEPFPEGESLEHTTQGSRWRTRKAASTDVKADLPSSSLLDF